jgi:hypothetical protein
MIVTNTPVPGARLPGRHVVACAASVPGKAALDCVAGPGPAGRPAAGRAGVGARGEREVRKGVPVLVALHFLILAQLIPSQGTLPCR